MQSNRVLVLDSQGQNSLAVTRTLGANGVSVTAGGTNRYLPGMLSRYSDDRFVYPDPATDHSAFVDSLANHLEGHEYAAVLPLTDLTTSLLSANKERLEATGTRVGAEDYDTFRRANDKGRLFEAAADLDVPTPETWVPESMGDVTAIDERRSTEVVIKPRRTTVTEDSGSSSTNRLSASNYVGTDEDLLDRFESLLANAPQLRERLPLVQEVVDGEDTKCTVGIADDGELLAHFQHEKFRVYPPSGGIGAVRQGIREPKMREYARRVVEMLEWTGPFHVEFMQTPDDEFYLLEVNGRYWGSTALTVNSGVDVPWLHYRQLRGDAVETRGGEYRTDVKQRKLFYHDLRWLRRKLSDGEYRAALPFFGSFFSTREEFLDPTDPLPFLGLVPRTVDALTNRKRGQGVYGSTATEGSDTEVATGTPTEAEPETATGTPTEAEPETATGTPTEAEPESRPEPRPGP